MKDNINIRTIEIEIKSNTQDKEIQNKLKLINNNECIFQVLEYVDTSETINH